MEYGYKGFTEEKDLFIVVFHMSQQQNKIVIITAPSGAGKTSITRFLLKVFPDQLAFSISATTRPARHYEKDDVDYYFISVEDFKKRIENEAFVEWEMVYEGKYYGTLKSELDRIWEDHKTPLLDVDVRGGVHVQKLFPETSLTLFIEPPSLDELRHRLESRGTETKATLEARIQKASFELSFKDKFNRVIVNDYLDRACEEARSIVGEFLGIVTPNS